MMNQRSQKCTDIVVEDHGSILILRGMTDAGYAWIEENCSSHGYQPFGLGARLVEPRYVRDIIEGAINDGLGVGSSAQSRAIAAVEMTE